MKGPGARAPGRGAVEGRPSCTLLFPGPQLTQQELETRGFLGSRGPHCWPRQREAYAREGRGGCSCPRVTLEISSEKISRSNKMTQYACRYSDSSQRAAPVSTSDVQAQRDGAAGLPRRQEGGPGEGPTVGPAQG